MAAALIVPIGAAIVLFQIGTNLPGFGRSSAGRSPSQADEEKDSDSWRPERERHKQAAEELAAAKAAEEEQRRKQILTEEERKNAAAHREPPNDSEPSDSKRGNTPQTSTKADPIKDALPSVAVVKMPDGHGSGFMANARTLVTNYHVIRSGRICDVRVGFPDNPTVRGRMFSVELLDEDPVNDLAILRVNCDVPPLPVDKKYVHVNGQKVVAIGSPGTGGPGGEMIANLTTDGRLGPEYRSPRGGALWTMSMPVNPGNSGGPILDSETGKVIGVVVAKFTKTESQSLAVPVPTLVETIDRALASDQSAVKRSNAMHRARFCLAHMAALLRLAKLSFAKSIEVARSAEDRGDGVLAAFNEFKSVVSRNLSDEFAHFDTTVTAEVRELRDDSACDMSIRLATEKLHTAIEEQVKTLRKSVPPNEIEHVVRDFRESLARAESLAATVAKSLAIEGAEVDE